MKIRLLAAAAPLALALAACGTASSGDDGIASASGGTSRPDSSASPSATLDPHEAPLKFAQCMREHGVDMPDPDTDGRIRVAMPKGMDKSKADAAMKACQPIMEQAVGDKAKMNDPEIRDRMVKFAQCMREHGVDMPDPSDGPIKLQVPEGGEQKLKEAQEACKEFAPNMGGKP
ncbi:hypothetical protein [Microtetraspora sp. NBRC 16547]|uniref:hypothetical protein n=1 Tax=Microtetraspora sp. NBRC 16547 TaxID=3030993 RepID=UPI0024A0B53F|nr:hypothetical protein [Microtetraspora sp. NBRC 16547]GLX00596.1 hypothetical protein Misp02_46820 [Microtetraspora sp. NBRC 16547]